MKVYIVMRHVPYEFDDIEAVYASEERAEAEAEKKNAGRKHDLKYLVHEHDVIEKDVF